MGEVLSGRLSTTLKTYLTIYVTDGREWIIFFRSHARCIKDLKTN